MHLLVFALLSFMAHTESTQVVICEGDEKTITCPSGRVIEVNSGYYGRMSTAVCPSDQDSNTGCEAGNSLAELRSACNDRSSCTIVASDFVFGNPCYGTHKYVEMEYSCVRSRFTTTVACEGSNLQLNCPRNQAIRIQSGFYGRQDKTTCHHSQIHTTDCKFDSSLDILMSYCEGMNTCSVSASDDVFGNPCVGTHKYIRVTYRCAIL